MGWFETEKARLRKENRLLRNTIRAINNRIAEAKQGLTNTPYDKGYGDCASYIERELLTRVKFHQSRQSSTTQRTNSDRAALDEQSANTTRRQGP